MTTRVLVDATPIPGQLTGVGVYATELLRCVEGVDLHVLANARDVAELKTSIPHAKIHAANVGPRPLRLLWQQTMLPLHARRLRADVFHGLHYTLPPRIGSAAVVTFHDPTFFTHPGLHERSKVAYFTRAARTGIRRATRVIAVSEYSRRGAIEHGGADPKRVDVVYEGVDLERFRPAETEPADPYVLFVGTLEPRKDVPTLIAAYAQVAKRGSPHELVLAGKPGWGYDAVQDALRGLGTGNVRVTGYVSEEQKVALYRGASVVVYPTIAEGFGLPVLEAMACGTPVVTTTGSAPEEIAGDAALLVPPRDVGAVRDAIERVLSDPQLAAELGRKGRERAQAFSWDRAAERTVEVWKRAAQERT